ncbi:sugar kinase [Erythrobacter sp. NFXS35]|uniref:sugar kinase n=1 Tax=Erythrobacter sp. NFXS35 TaxID=2818436 RepID=UPI0032DE61B9
MAGVIACFGEVLLRYSPPAPLLLAQARQFDVCTGGAEANVAVALARLGRPTRMLTVLPDNVLGQKAKSDLASHGVDISCILHGAGRMGSYFLDVASGLRTGKVTYDREHSAFAQAISADWAISDWLNGVSHLHLSGVTLALNEGLADASLALAKAAKANGATISFDGNFRSALWERSKRDPRDAFTRMFAVADIIFANHKDAGLVLGRTFSGEGPERRREAALALLDAFPGIAAVASTARHIEDAASHHVSARIDTRQGADQTDPWCISGIVDRIGTGDAFAAGVLHRWMDDRTDLAGAVGSGLGLMALKHSTWGDASLASAADLAAMIGRASDVAR